MVVNITNSSDLDTVVEWRTDLDGDLGQFSGMVLDINNQKNVNVLPDLSGFHPSSENDYSYIFSPFNFGGIATTGVKYPRNYGLVFADSAIYETRSVDLLRTNGQTLTIDPLMVNYRLIDLDDPNREIGVAVIDQQWSYYSLAPGLPDSIPLDSIKDNEHYLNPDQFEYFHVTDTVLGTWSDLGFSYSPLWGTDYAIKVQLLSLIHI